METTGGPTGASADDSTSTRINLEQSRKQAKDLLKAFRAGEPRALDKLRWNHPRFRKLSDAEIVQQEFRLADAQLVIARLHHIESWPKLLQHIVAIENADPAINQFEDAADAIVSGNLLQLRAMLSINNELVHQRSTRAHNSTLLHYVSANGVEDYRQKTPHNIVDITRFLLDAGSEVDAKSNAYGGGSTTLGLTATSAHPRLAGVQLELIDLLIERGAVVDGANCSGGAAHACVANGCPEAAVHLIERGATADNLYGAAGLGRVDVVRELVGAAGRKQRESALVIAAQCDHAAVVEFLLEQGVDIAARDDGMTVLHWAAANGNLPLVDLVLARGAALETTNEFGGTVLSSTLWFAYHALPGDFAERNYPAVFDRLLAAGARTDVYDGMREDIDGVYRRSARANT